MGEKERDIEEKWIKRQRLRERERESEREGGCERNGERL